MFLSEKDVLSLFAPADAIAAAEETFLHIGLGDIAVGKMVLLFADDEQKNNFHSMPAVLRHRGVAGVKWISTYSAPLPGYPFSHGNLVLLSSTATGSPLAIVGATNITAMRTAGGHGVVQARHLANPSPEVLSVFGCGAQARAGVFGFIEEFPSIRQIRIFSRSSEPVYALRDRLSGRVEVVYCQSPEGAVSGSSLILLASGARAPLLTADMLRPGMTIIGIEGFRDMEPSIAKRADKWYLGFRQPDTDIINSKSLNPGGKLCMADVYGDMTELLTGKCAGREREDEIIVSTHMGMGAHDVCCAAMVYQRAVEAGVGQRLQLA